jgi:hypothetical protein
MRTFNAGSNVTNVQCDSCGEFVLLTGDQSKPASTVVSPGWYRCGSSLAPTDACCDVHAYKQGGPRQPGSTVATKQLVTLG